MSNGDPSVATDQKIWRSSDAGFTWLGGNESEVDPIPDFPENATPFASCVLADGSVLIGTAGNGLGTGGAQIWKSIDDGLTWFLVTVLNDDPSAAGTLRAPGTHVLHSHYYWPN
jgi:hypothetical protein